MAGEEILVVEDDPQVAHLIQHFLSREGYRVQVARDGRAGRELLELAYSLQSPPDLLVLDVHLPFLDGFALLHHVTDVLEPKRAEWKDDETPSSASSENEPGGFELAQQRLRVLLLTVQARDEDVVRGLELGAMDYLPKPFSVNVLCARVRNLLRWERRP